jgi:hypothetical protein
LGGAGIWNRPAQSHSFDPARTFEAAAVGVAGDGDGSTAAAAGLELWGNSPVLAELELEILLELMMQ